MRSSVSLFVAAVALGLSGCATDDAGSGELSGLPEPEPSVAVDDAISGVGPTGFPGVDLPIPAEARSVAVTFECDGGEPFSLELGDSMMLGQAPLSGTCDGESELTWPITAKTGPTLGVFVADGVAWVATTEFSTDEFVVDAALTSDCTRFSDVYSALLNADTGYTQYNAFDETEWALRVDAASAELEDLANTAESSLREEFARMSRAVSDPTRAVGSAVTTAAAQELTGPIGEACAVNQTPVIIQSEFGG
ncbi:hypothetical protein [Microbacterium sp.]|jgi:hypothetical protein|uniref:hypothetical protein n=1 Tax=Microbacterium sp. TaxID=51671 RepID=UPI0037C5B677